MSTDKQEIDRIINEIICNGNYWAKKFGADGSSIGGFIWANDAGRLTPPSWPKFDANWIRNEFYIGALKTEHLHEWLEHLFRLKLGAAEWQPIEAAPKGCKKLILGFFNESDELETWRTCGGYLSQEVIDADETGEFYGLEEGWYEVSVGCDPGLGNVWPVSPTHWMPLSPFKHSDEE